MARNTAANTPADDAGQSGRRRDLTRETIGGAEVAGLEALDLDGLRAAWHARFGRSPALRSTELLRLMLAWRIQATAQGGLDRDTRRRLARRSPVKAEGLNLGIGAVLRREWRGQIVEVVVEEDGFRWEDRLYPSLSAAATVIAGSRWNGPRFFGLRRDQE